MSNLTSASLAPLPKEKELAFAKQAAKGNKEAREILIRANIRFALTYAKRFYGHGLTNEEVNEEAVIGLIKAVDHFDYTRDVKVITFAKMYIMNEILLSCNKSIPCLSLDDSTGSELEETKLSTIPDNASYTPEETAIYHIQKEQLYEKLDYLDSLEKQIICMYNGLLQYKEPYSLSEIGKELGESKQYIHYIKERALLKLKNSMSGIAA